MIFCFISAVTWRISRFSSAVTWRISRFSSAGTWRNSRFSSAVTWRISCFSSAVTWRTFRQPDPPLQQRRDQDLAVGLPLLTPQPQLYEQKPGRVGSGSAGGLEDQSRSRYLMAMSRPTAILYSSHGAAGRPFCPCRRPSQRPAVPLQCCKRHKCNCLTSSFTLPSATVGPFTRSNSKVFCHRWPFYSQQFQGLLPLLALLLAAIPGPLSPLALLLAAIPGPSATVGPSTRSNSRVLPPLALRTSAECGIVGGSVGLQLDISSRNSRAFCHRWPCAQALNVAM